MNSREAIAAGTGTDTGEDDFICLCYYLRIAADNGIRAHSLERRTERVEISYSVINNAKHQRTPLLEGITSGKRLSLAAAARIALALALNAASRM